LKITRADLEKAFKGYYEALYRYAYTMVRNIDIAKDIVQQAFLKVWEKKDNIEITLSLKSYLFQAVHNLSINYKTRTQTFAPLNHQDFQPEQAIGTQQIEYKQLQLLIAASIEKLPTQCRTAFIQNREHGYSYSEIAQAMNLSQKTVEAHISKALKILRAEIGPHLMVLMMFQLINTQQ
jgi:RNA polymerase sigma-70 factor, ECF subfamily